MPTTITGTYVDQGGTPLTGALRFRPTRRHPSVQSTLRTQVAKLDSSGSFSITLPSTTDPAASPVPFRWEVQELTSAEDRRVFEIDATGPTLALRTVAPDVGSVPGKIVRYEEGANAPGGGGAVSSVVGQTGAVTGTQILADSTVATALSGKAATVHVHSAADVTSGTLPLTRGGTGGTDAATARTNLGLGTAATQPATSFALRAPDWITDRAYVVGELVVSSGTLYRCTTAHTSSGSINLSNFAVIGGGNFIQSDVNGRLAVSRAPLNQFGGAVPVTTANNAPQKATLFGGVTLMTTRSLHKTTVASTDFVLVAPSWWAGNSPFSSPQGLANNYTVKASIEFGGVTYPVTWNGVRTATVEPFASVVSDPVGVHIPASTEFYIRAAFTTPAANGEIPINVNTQGVFGTSRPSSGGAQGGYTSGSDTVDATGAPTASDSFARAGLLVLGRPLGTRSPVVVGIGDSIMRGQTDTINDGGGFLIRGVGSLVATLNTGIPSMPASLLAGPGAGAVNLRKLWALGTHALVAQGTNDLANGRTLAQLQSDVITLGSMCAGRGLSATLGTMVPRSTSTDSWATLGNQALVSTNTNRVAYNNWVRDGIPVNSSTLAPVATGTVGALRAGSAGHPYSSWIELADTVESARDSGLWKVDGTASKYTNDGIHPNSFGYTAMAVPVTTWASALSA